LADYREHYKEIRAAGVSLAAVSMDAPEKLEAVRQELHLPFPILCDTERRVIQEWDIYNPREKGAIAKPAVFVIDRDRTVRYGAGTLTYEGTFLSDTLRVVLEALKSAGIIGPDQELPAPVRAKHGLNAFGKRIHYFLNYSSEEQTFKYAYAKGIDLLTVRSTGASPIHLGPWDLAIVQEQ
jgi:hypothetical protein